jgi:hypothetical protein
MKPLLVACCLAAALALPVRPACAAAPTTGTELHCPATLVQAPVTDDVPAGWVVHGETGRLPLQRAAFYDGDPVGLGALAPDTTRRSGLTETSTWRFDGTDSGRVWLGCLYRDASAVVARPLPGGLRQCTTTLRLTSLGDPAGQVSVSCR